MGLSQRQRLAIACGNHPYEDDIVCPHCDGVGTLPPFDSSDGYKTARCDWCEGRGYVTAPCLAAAETQKTPA